MEYGSPFESLREEERGTRSATVMEKREHRWIWKVYCQCGGRTTERRARVPRVQSSQTRSRLPGLPWSQCTWDSRNFTSSRKCSIWINIRISFSTLAIFVSHLTSLLEAHTATLLALKCDNMHQVSPTKEVYPRLSVQTFPGASSKRSSQVPALRRSTDSM